MLAYVPRGNTLERVMITNGGDVPEDSVWIDLVNPVTGEDKLIERRLGIAIRPAKRCRRSRFPAVFTSSSTRFMTATLMCQSDTAAPKTTAVTFILSGHRLVTVRYDDPRPFMIVSNKLARSCPSNVSGESVLMDLLDAVIDRAADILERIGVEVDLVSRDIFEPQETNPKSRALSYNDILKAIGSKGDLTSKVRESLVSIGRLLLFLSNEAEGMRWPKDTRSQLQSMRRDISRSPITPPAWPTRSPSARRHARRRADQQKCD